VRFRGALGLDCTCGILSSAHRFLCRSSGLRCALGF
jgi:hypothetical protein